eukprot:9095592-Pyramimonas_sp.AAC.1
MAHTIGPHAGHMPPMAHTIGPRLRTTAHKGTQSQVLRLCHAGGSQGARGVTIVSRRRVSGSTWCYDCVTPEGLRGHVVLRLCHAGGSQGARSVTIGPHAGHRPPRLTRL